MDSQSQVKGPGRPPQFDRELVEDQLLALFWEHGYDQVSQQQMAAATGLSTSSLYNSFGTKAQILESALQRYIGVITRLLGPLENGTRGLADIDDFLDSFEHELDGPIGERGCLITTLMTADAGREGPTRTIADEYRGRLRAAFAAALRRAADEGAPVPDPAAVAPVLVATVLGILTTTRATAGGDEAREQLQGLRDITQGWRAPV